MHWWRGFVKSWRLGRKRSGCQNKTSVVKNIGKFNLLLIDIIEIPRYTLRN